MRRGIAVGLGLNVFGEFFSGVFNTQRLLQDRAVEPVAMVSRSSSTQSMPASRRRTAAVKPQAPAPTMTTGTCGVSAGMLSARTMRVSVL
jgi:hypothetical protein